MEARKNISPEFVLGAGALTLVGRYAVNFGAQKVLLVTDPGVAAAGWSGKVAEALAVCGVPSFVFAGIKSNPRDLEVMQGAALYHDEQCDVIVAVGGGSPMDCAKGIGIVASNDRNILEFEGVDRVAVPGPPLICIPTTAGSSADVSQFAIINDTTRKVKIAIISKATIPDVSLIDPTATTSMSAALTAATGMDALVHAIEAYVSQASSPVTDLHALAAIRLVRTNLSDAIRHPFDLRFRDQMALGSLLAGLAFSNASLGLVHAMAHALGGLKDLPHGECNALLLAPVLNFNFDAAPERYRSIADAFGLETAGLSFKEIRESLVSAVEVFRQSVGLTARLGDYGIGGTDIHLLAKYAYEDPCLVTNPRQPSLDDIERIYEQALIA